MSKIKVLLVDDEHDLASQLCENLIDYDFEANFITNPEETFAKVNKFQPDVILMDKLMPQRNGLDVVRDLRESGDNTNIPIIMLTACKTKKDLMDCFERGVDDFIPKPFDFDELRMRINALYKRHKKNPPRLLKFENVYMDTAAQTVFVNKQEVNLTLTEFKLLKTLLSYKNEALHRDKLCLEALGREHVIKRTVDVHMMALRKKLGDASDLIKTVRGVGYKLTASM